MPITPPTSQQSQQDLRARAEGLAANYPALLAQAERVANIVAQGVHGRRRAGSGESFWQYREFTPSDTARQIDWRRSARSDHLYVRENEWEAANTVWMWRDGAAGMDWHSDPALPTKQERANTILMALSILLMRAGERCGILGESERPRSGQFGIERLCGQLAGTNGKMTALNASIPAHCKLVLASDFLPLGANSTNSPLDHHVWREKIAKLSARPAKGILLHIIDPAERDFPYKGRLKLFEAGTNKMAQKIPFLVGRAQTIKEQYRAAFDAHEQSVENTARRLGWTRIVHTTDQPASHALSALYQALSGENIVSENSSQTKAGTV